MILDGDTPLSDSHVASGADSNQQSKKGYRAYLERVKSGPEKDPEDIWIRKTIRDFGAFQLLSPYERHLGG